jgi:AAA domain
MPNPDVAALMAGYADVIDHEDRGPKANGAASHEKSLVLLTATDFVSGYQPARPLIKAWDTKPGWLYSFTAPTGNAKTSIALAEAISQATAGRTIVYLAGENPDDVRARMVLMKDRLGIDRLPDTLRFVDRTFHMPDTMEFLRELIDALGGADLIFVDTSPAFQAVSGAVEENSNTEQLRWAMVLRQMTKFKGNPAVIALCHPTKRPQSIEESIPRGGGAFLAEVDGNYVSWLKADDGERKFFDFTWTGKFRGSFEPVSYVVEIGTCDALADPDGNLVRTVWAHAADEHQISAAAREQTDAEDALMTAMVNYPNKSLAEWARLLEWQKYQVHRVMKRLATEKLVQMKRGRYVLTPSGKEEAKRASDTILDSSK